MGSTEYLKRAKQTLAVEREAPAPTCTAGPNVCYATIESKTSFIGLTPICFNSKYYFDASSYNQLDFVMVYKRAGAPTQEIVPFHSLLEPQEEAASLMI